MGFELGEERSKLELLMTPGAVIAIVGLVILLVSIFFFSTADSGNPDLVDAMIESKANNGQRLKAMIGMVVGTVTSVAGVLWTLMRFSRS